MTLAFIIRNFVYIKFEVMKSKIHELRPNNFFGVSKKIVMAFAASMVFGYATAQLEPKTNQKQTSDTIAIPQPPKSDDNIANKGILHRNTLEAGSGKPDNIKRKLNDPPTPTQPNIPRVKVDTTTAKPRNKL